MFGWIMDRMVERAIPPDVEDAAQERIAQEAAENAIRQVVMISGIAGLFVCAALAALLYGFLPSWQIVHGASQPSPSEVASRFEADAAKLLQAKEEKEDSEEKLQQVEMERDALQGKVADLERRMAALTAQQPQAAEVAPVSQDPEERNRPQRKVGDLEPRVTDPAQKLQTARAAAATDRGVHILKPARPSSTPVSTEPRRAYRCGDGRSVHDPATCKATAPTPPEVVPSIPEMYHCGDGRSVPNPAVCRSAGALSPRG